MTTETEIDFLSALQSVQEGQFVEFTIANGPAHISEVKSNLVGHLYVETEPNATSTSGSRIVFRGNTKTGLVVENYFTYFAILPEPTTTLQRYGRDQRPTEFGRYVLAQDLPELIKRVRQDTLDRVEYLATVRGTKDMSGIFADVSAYHPEY